MINWNGQSKFFIPKEFECPCCHIQRMNDRFVRQLDLLREACGFPFIINSGYRCEKHNREKGGALASAHLEGLAADIRIQDDRKRGLIITKAFDFGFKRIGVGKNFIHIDIRETEVPVIWVY